ncbi:MAG: ImmA/IrrE family metallo-endopeptidase [Fimbriimonadaceae bacterium]
MQSNWQPENSQSLKTKTFKKSFDCCPRCAGKRSQVLNSRRRTDALLAFRKASETRAKFAIPATSPISPIDLAEKLGVCVRFLDAPSMEGLYRHGASPLIMLGAQRPAGRQNFTCAHELGHHIFGHGTRVDELNYIATYDTDEFLADMFSAFLLMPEAAVATAFRVHEWSPTSSTPLQVYTIASTLGVAYGALVNQMVKTLRLISTEHAYMLSRVRPKDIRAELLGSSAFEELILADSHWTCRPIDLRIGDILSVPIGISPLPVNLCNIGKADTREFLQAVQPGVGQLVSEALGWAQFVRVSRRQYTGLARFRYLEDPDNDNID